ncbi:MAG: hypothetical protein ACQES5_05095 [Thermodesulfobacteriota bacterium]
MRFLKSTLMIVALFCFGLVGCGPGINLNVDTLPVSSKFGQLKPRVPKDKCIYIPEEEAPSKDKYTVLARYVVQESTQVTHSQGPQTMICHVFEKARAQGADAVIVESMDTKNVAGYARTSPVIKLKAIRFNQNIPQGALD